MPDDAGDVEMARRSNPSSAAAVGQEVCPARPLGRRPRRQLDETLARHAQVGVRSSPALRSTSTGSQLVRANGTSSTSTHGQQSGQAVPAPVSASGSSGSAACSPTESSSANL